MGANNLSTLLRREQELLELLVLKLEEEQLMLTEGRFSWLRHVVREIEAVLVRLQTTGIDRAAEAAAVALEWGVEDTALRQLVDHAPDEVVRDVLHTHLAAVTALTAEIADLQGKNLRSLGAATRGTLDRLATIGAAEPVAESLRRGVPATVGSGESTHLLDRQG